MSTRRDFLKGAAAAATTCLAPVPAASKAIVPNTPLYKIFNQSDYYLGSVELDPIGCYGIAFGIWG